MANKYNIQHLRDRQVNTYSENIPLRSSTTNYHHLSSHNNHDIQKQKQRIVSYEDKANSIVKKYETIINKTNPKVNAENQKVCVQPDRKKYQIFQDNKHAQAQKTSYEERFSLKQPKSQLQNNRQILQAMKNDLHSKLNDLSKQTATQSIIYREQIPSKLDQNTNKRHVYEVSSGINLRTSSNSFAKQYKAGPTYYKLYDKNEEKIDKNHYITFKADQTRIQNDEKQIDKFDRKERNNKMIEEQISKLDKRIKEIQQNKTKSCSLLKKKPCAKIQNQIINIKICQSIHLNNRNKKGQLDMHKRSGQLVQKNSSPLNQNWKQYNNRYKHYISKMKPFEMISNSTIINPSYRDERIYQMNSKSRDNEYFKHNLSSMMKTNQQVIPYQGCQQQLRLYKRRTIQYKYKNDEVNHSFGHIIDIDKVR